MTNTPKENWCTEHFVPNCKLCASEAAEKAGTTTPAPAPTITEQMATAKPGDTIVVTPQEDPQDTIIVLAKTYAKARKRVEALEAELADLAERVSQAQEDLASAKRIALDAKKKLNEATRE